jgi:hypothetical protein
MVIVAGLLFLILFYELENVFYVCHRKSESFIPLLGSLLSAGLVTFLGWKLLLVYPQYNDLLNGYL